jgi:hypothetical protein
MERIWKRVCKIIKFSIITQVVFFAIYSCNIAKETRVYQYEGMKVFLYPNNTYVLKCGICLNDWRGNWKKRKDILILTSIYDTGYIKDVKIEYSRSDTGKETVINFKLFNGEEPENVQLLLKDKDYKDTLIHVTSFKHGSSIVIKKNYKYLQIRENFKQNLFTANPKSDLIQYKSKDTLNVYFDYTNQGYWYNFYKNKKFRITVLN